MTRSVTKTGQGIHQQGQVKTNSMSGARVGLGRSRAIAGSEARALSEQGWERIGQCRARPALGRIDSELEQNQGRAEPGQAKVQARQCQDNVTRVRGQ